MPDGRKFLSLTEKQKYLPCRDRTYTESYFLTTNTPAQPEPASMAEAKEMCSLCPILEQCRAEGFRLNDKWSVYGGLSPADRAEIKQQAQELGLAA